MPQAPQGITPINPTLNIPDKDTKPVTLPVTSTAVFVSSTKSFHPDGLYSNTIFGIQGSPERSTTFGHIHLKVDIIHPRIYRNLIKAVKLYDNIMRGKAFAIWNPKTKNFEKSSLEDGDTGYSFFLSHINELKVEDSGSLSRGQLIELLDKYPQRRIRYLPVMPAGLRDYIVDDEGKPSKDEVNDLYTAIINTVNILVEDGGRMQDTTVYLLQQKVNTLTRYLLDDTLYSFINKRWVNRRIFGGTKNVMTSYQQPSVDLDSPIRPNLNDTFIGLYQAVKSSPEHVVYSIKEGFMRNIFIEGSAINVVNKKNLSAVVLDFDQNFYDLIYDSEGVLKLMDSLKYEAARSRDIEVGDNYLALIYENYEDHEVQILHDIGDLHPDKDKSKVRPINLVDIFFMSAHHVLHRKGALGNRHPVMDNGGIYAGNNYLKVTNRLTYMHVINGEGVTVSEINNYPIYSSGFFTSVSPNVARLGPLSGDYDGDTSGNIVLNTEDAQEEIADKLKQARQYISADGSLHYSLSNGVLPLVLASITG